MKWYIVLLLIHHTIAMLHVGYNWRFVNDTVHGYYKNVPSLLAAFISYTLSFLYLYIPGAYLSFVVEVLLPALKDLISFLELRSAFRYYFTSYFDNADAAGIRRLKEWKLVIENRQREGRSEMWYRIKWYWCIKVLEHNHVFFVPYVFKEDAPSAYSTIPRLPKLTKEDSVDTLIETRNTMNGIIYRGKEIIRLLKKSNKKT